MATAADCPGIYDLIVNGQGYMFDTSYDDSPFRKPPAQYSYTPTFLERTNISGSYGDDSQAFFLTASQNDWSLGEGRKFFRGNDPDGVRRFWSGTNLDASVPGQVTISRFFASVSSGTSIRALESTSTLIYAAGTTNLLTYSTPGGGFVSLGAHGLGAAPSQWGLTTDGINAYVSTTAGGTVGVRKWDGSIFTTFSATGADSLAFLNNVLYGYQESTGRLIQYSTAGVASTVFTWQDAAGAPLTGAAYKTRLRAYGGVLSILRTQGSHGCGELWEYDGTSTSELGGFPENFAANEMEIVSGIIFVSGYVIGTDAAFSVVPQIYFYISGQIGLWWKGQTGWSNLTWPAMAAYGNGLAFTDDSTGRILQGNTAVGGAYPFGSYTPSNATVMMAANANTLLHTRNASTAYAFPVAASGVTSGTVVESLFDFDSSRNKLPRGISVEFDSDTTGNGGTVDIAYQFNSVTGSWVNLQTGAVSGTEYALPNTASHSVGVRVTLNLGTSTNGPTLKRVYVAGAPYLTAFRNNTYLLDCSGNKQAEQPRYVRLVNKTDSTRDGDEMRGDLVTALLAGPIQITDRFGTYTGIIEPGGTTFREVRAEYGRAEYRVELAVRQIQ